MGFLDAVTSVIGYLKQNNTLPSLSLFSVYLKSIKQTKVIKLNIQSITIIEFYGFGHRRFDCITGKR